MKLIKFAVIFTLVISIAYISFFNDSSINIVNFESIKKENQNAFEHPSDPLSSVKIPQSLQGIHITPNFLITHNNELAPNYEIITLFEHYLSAYGESDLTNIIRLIQIELAKHLKQPALGSALDLLKRYIDYKIALKENETSLAINYTGDNLVAQLHQAKHHLDSIRRDFFSDLERSAFFKDEELQSDFLIRQIAINQNTELTPEQKQAELELAYTALPDSIQKSRNNAQQFAQLRQATQAAKLTGASEDDIYRMRESKLGTESAIQLALLDEQRNQWQQRLNHFSGQRKNILQSALSEFDQQQSIKQLLDSQFNELEQKRVSAMMNHGHFD